MVGMAAVKLRNSYTVSQLSWVKKAFHNENDSPTWLQILNYVVPLPKRWLVYCIEDYNVKVMYQPYKNTIRRPPQTTSFVSLLCFHDKEIN